MNKLLIPLICPYILFVISGCDISINENTTKKTFTRADSIWVKFASALESNNIAYLKANSLDSIKCTECKCGPMTKNDLFPSEIIFQNCLSQLIHLKCLSDEEYDTSEYDGIIYVNYHIESKYAEEGGYNLIFYFMASENGYKFQGMLVT